MITIKRIRIPLGSIVDQAIKKLGENQNVRVDDIKFDRIDHSLTIDLELLPKQDKDKQDEQKH